MVYPSEGEDDGSRPECHSTVSNQNAAGSVAGALLCSVMLVLVCVALQHMHCICGCRAHPPTHVQLRRAAAGREQPCILEVTWLNP